jgi:hypothetical protein
VHSAPELCQHAFYSLTVLPVIDENGDYLTACPTDYLLL